jgi:branched-chain amino acid transport system permease protein
MAAPAEARRKERIDRPIKALSDDVYILSSPKLMLYLAGPRIFPSLLLLLMPLVLPSVYHLKILIAACCFAVLAMAFDFLLHTVGLACLGCALFFGLGAYSAGCLNYYYGVPPYISIVVGPLMGAALATLAIIPSLRLRGIYFAIVTLALPLMISRIIEATLILGGTDGLIVDPLVAGIPYPLNFIVEAYIIIGVALVTLFTFKRIYRITDLGRVLNSIGDNDMAVKASGINVTFYKALAVFIAALPSAFAGAYVAHTYEWIGLSHWSLDYSIFPIAAAVVGGGGTIAGPALGAFLLVPISEVLREAGALRVVFYALTLAAFILWKPEGIMNWLWRKYHQMERWVKV